MSRENISDFTLASLGIAYRTMRPSRNACRRCMDEMPRCRNSQTLSRVRTVSFKTRRLSLAELMAVNEILKEYGGVHFRSDPQKSSLGFQSIPRIFFTQQSGRNGNGGYV
jgi:hypothetical protein